ncbi:MAG: ribose 5-phosphate isomerase B [Eubacteriales bacterium]|nr:ribose 5-phosphate isomerase B [Eubacteriales bacterium]NLF47695.1 ribose 5-phosphate isomerase B [Clostridiales bacterium]
MKIAIAADHGGYELKEKIKEYLESIYANDKDVEILDIGTDSDASVDYPMYGKKCAEKVASGQAQKGIVICGTGIGISIAANKVKGIRCALCTNEKMAEMSRKHNDANMLALGGRITDPDTALRIVDVWLKTNFEGGRHKRRVDMLDCI